MSQSQLNDRGCRLGDRVQAAPGSQELIVILDFGGQINSAANGWMFSLFGGTNRTDDWVRDAVKSFGRGFFVCSGGDSTSEVTIGLGTNNSVTVTADAGRVVANRAEEADNYVENNYRGQVHVVGANDIEPGFGDDSAMRNWVDGFDAANTTAMYNYGSADGCSTTGIPSTCANGWRASDVWYASYYGPNYPVPEIYTGSGSQARQWKYLSLWSYEEKGFAMIFKASLTQYRACTQYPPCNGTNNTPDEGWSQLRNQLLSNEKTDAGAADLKKTGIGWN